MQFAGKRVWIIGASSGIGAALTRALGARGARLVVSARRRAEIEQLAEECRGQGIACEAVPIDLTVAESVRDAVATVDAEPIDCVVFSAGVAQRALVAETDLSVDRRLMEVNYFGPVSVTKKVLPGMLRRGGGGLFVVVSSIAGKVGTPMRSGYAASKHALHGFFESLRAELHDHGIRVCLVCPGYIKTEITRHSLRGDGSEYGRVGGFHEKAMPAERCAQIVAENLIREREEFGVGWGMEMHALWMKRLFPGVTSRLMRRHRVS